MPSGFGGDWLTRHAYAHRGLHGSGVPENSLAAFEAAIARGYGIECDLLPSADNRAVVFHDEDLQRLTGQAGSTRRTRVGELTAMRLSGSDETIPTLRDMLALVAGRVPLLLELKSVRGEHISALCRAVRRDLEGYRGEVAVMSFDPRIPAWFAARMPHLPRGVVMTEENARTLTGALRRWLALAKSRASFLAYDVRDLPSRFATRSGLPLLTWTVRSGALLDAARGAGAAPIMEGPGVAAFEERS
ncbi:glycerophosphodiester phosphodiesterase family protein [Aurantiacibacter luteus]|uniref:GP-PDE domain-containing protein n=1 Tax=Aurantiacibacter luteus TaxID=1581420 RepID=A0A0G9MUR9_9SPHN|nr:glycerophosphodiester phosphodiesterase family protein [Aurantiacibacter luteus]KLE34482.1 hypothetical protein AAW00_09695 [Aurantiacibacter luteus]